VRTLDIREYPGRRPLDILFERFVPEFAPTDIRSAGELVRQDSFARNLLWLEGVDNSTWETWKKFLVDYTRAARSTGILDRTVFGLVLSGSLAAQLPGDDTCLSCRQWRGVLDSLDVQLFAASRLRELELVPVERQIAVATIARIALWDLSLAERLLEEPLESILAPRAVLQAVAAERGWSADDLKTADWHRGMYDAIDGELAIHSALLALSDPERELPRRLWEAQVGVFFPIVEEGRRAVIERLNGSIKLPIETPFGRIEDPRDLEIGQIDRQITWNDVRADHATRRLVRCLKRIRDALAHLEPLAPETLLVDDVLALNLRSAGAPG
jgi:hypothetical protein